MLRSPVYEFGQPGCKCVRRSAAFRVHPCPCNGLFSNFFCQHLLFLLKSLFEDVVDFMAVSYKALKIKIDGPDIIYQM